MKIAIIVSELGMVGGTEIQTHEIAKRLSEKNEVTVFTRSCRGCKNVDKRDGFRIRRIRYFNVPFIGHVLFTILLVLSMIKNKKDIEVIQSMMIINGFSGMIAKIVLRVPMIICIRTSYYIENENPFLRMRNHVILRFADLAITQTRITRDEFSMGFPGLRIRVIPNAISPSGKASGDSRRVIYVGRLIDVKGVEYLIRAMKIIRNKASLLVVGDGKDRKGLERLSKGLDVRFAGEVGRDRIIEYMGESCVLVLPSISEGFPNIVLEAMSLGVPVIASRVGGIPDIVKDGETGFLVEPGNPRDIAKYIDLLLGNRKLRREMSEKSLREVRKYSWSNTIAEYEKVYKSVLG
jgi:glycosyltransferase involved in cell wall biosynthesis